MKNYKKKYKRELLKQRNIKNNMLFGLNLFNFWMWLFLIIIAFGICSIVETKRLTLNVLELTQVNTVLLTLIFVLVVLFKSMDVVGYSTNDMWKCFKERNKIFKEVKKC